MQHFAETLSGVSSIRAFSASPRFVAENDKRVAANFAAFWTGASTNRWLGIRLSWLGTTVVGVACVVRHDYHLVV